MVMIRDRGHVFCFRFVFFFGNSFVFFCNLKKWSLAENLAAIFFKIEDYTQTVPVRSGFVPRSRNVMNL